MKRLCLYETDETAWLEKISKPIDERRYGEPDYKHLGEYLLDIVNRDRREVFRRRTTLLTPVLQGQEASRGGDRFGRRAVPRGMFVHAGGSAV
ncbi:MAG TPA: DUF29 family protein [Gemmataceae bacterium]|nr:DUF29 family protein [Gemmataceae bacterium]